MQSTSLDFAFAGLTLTARASGALWVAAHRTLCVSDLHLGKSDRIARRAGLMLPPYESRATLDRLADEIAATDPGTVICLGDSFDDIAASAALDAGCRETLLQLQAGRCWYWLEGNHDPGPLDLGGTHRADMALGPLSFRHIAQPGAQGEISGHYHPKLSLPGGTRSCFVFDAARAILPAFGAYTGGLSATHPAIRGLFAPRAYAILTGRRSILTAL